MKKTIITALFVLIVSAGLAQKVIFHYPSYTSYWNSLTKIPDSVIYTAIPHVKVCNREAEFHADGVVPNMQSDYAHSGYDIGHFCNASDENGNSSDEYNSFSYCNVAPQVPKLNRITWLALEDYIRALNMPVKVKITWSGVKSHIGKDSVTVPLYCIKEIWYSGHDEVYKMPNSDTVLRHQFTYYRIQNK